MTTQATTPTPEPPAARRLTRSSSDRVIAGVAGGLGRYFGIDPVVVRIIFVVLLFFGGAGAVAYGATWLLVPRDDAPEGRFGRGALVRRTGLVLALIIASCLLAFGGAWAAAAGGSKGVAIAVIAAGLVLAGAGIAGGRQARWLILPALALAIPAGVVAAADVDARGGVGERIYRPLAASELRNNYRLGVGHLVVDLRNAHLGPGTHNVHLKLGMGGAEVLVPPNACVSSQAHIGVGGTQVFDRNSGGIDVEWQDEHNAAGAATHVVVDADIGIGGLRIEPQMHGRVAGNGACVG